jgi:hypothetical protein
VSPTAAGDGPAARAGELLALLARVEKLEDEHAILQRLYVYGHSLDYGDEDRWLDCFTADGSFVVDRGADTRTSYIGRAELAAFVRAHTRAPANWHKHLLVEPRIHCDGDRATASSYFVRLDGMSDGPVVRSFGRYVDQLIRDDGNWRIQQRVVEVEAHMLPGMGHGRAAEVSE